MKHQLATIIPAYNEEKSIAQVVNNWCTELNRLKIDFKLHVYNDGSKDNTLGILNEISLQNKNLVVHHKPNSGHGPTLVKAYRENSADYEWIFQTDSDNELGIELFEELWNQRSNHDFLIGYRERSYQPAIRKLISLVSRITVWLLYGSRVYDVNSPYRLMRTDKFRNLFFKLPETMYAPNMAIAGYASLRKLGIYQAAIKQNIRKTSIMGTVKISKVIKSFFEILNFRFSTR